MNIYFACSITGGREFEPAYQSIVAALLADGHEILTAHLVKTAAVAEEQSLLPREVYDRDVNWLRNCEALIAEVSVPSHGVGFEIAFALNEGKRVLCLYQEGRKVSKMITGNPHPALVVSAYSTIEQAILIAQKFIANVGKLYL